MRTGNSWYKYLGPIPFLIFYTWLVVQTAWVSDDAHITFRSIENFIHGYGPVYNIGERVQTFTHPLWFLVQSLVNLIIINWKNNPFGGGQLYFVNILISIVISSFTVMVFWFWVATDTRAAILGISILFLSKAYVDYSTSGLENPLTHLITISFLAIYFSANQKSSFRLYSLPFLAAAAGTNRLDILLLFIPALLSLFWENTDRVKVLKALSIGFLPLIAWEIFSVIYYGFPFPNTAYAKLNTGIGLLVIMEQGVYYYLNSIKLDPITLLTIFAALILCFYKKDKSQWAIFIGVILYLFYILYIGGDFMSGRFFTPPLLVAVALLSRFEFTSFKTYGLSLVLVFTIGILPIYTISERNPSFGKDTRRLIVFVDPHGISDERHFYFKEMGFLNSLANGAPATYKGEWVYHTKESAKVELVGTLGVAGLKYGPDVHIIDRNALADPLMGRMPLQDIHDWRIGHFRHIVPDGYKETLISGRNQINDPGIALYYDKLSIVIKGDLWNWSRMMEIWNLNTGKYDYLIKT